MNTVNEYDQIRNMLGKIRLIKEDVEPTNPAQINVTNPNTAEEETTNKSGEKVTFDGINTVGFLSTQDAISDDVKNSITTSVGEFLKGTGLIMDTVNITVDDGQVVLSTETIKNPGLDAIKSITFDTDEENPKVDVVAGLIELNNDVINVLQSVAKTYNDNQIGRNKLITATQGNNSVEQPQ
jgi:hypothetical protein